MRTSHKPCSHIIFKLSIFLWNILHKLAMKGHKNYTKAKRHGQRVTGAARFPCGELFIIMCAVRGAQLVLRTLNTLGKCLWPTRVDDILKWYGSAESPPSCSRANLWILHSGCLAKPSWLCKSPRGFYLIWCLRKNKQINETPVHNAFIIIPTVFPQWCNVCKQTRNSYNKKRTRVAKWWWEHPELPGSLYNPSNEQEFVEPNRFSVIICR